MPYNLSLVKANAYAQWAGKKIAHRKRMEKAARGIGWPGTSIGGTYL